MSVYHYVDGNESNPVYQALEEKNRDRQYGFLESIVHSSISLNKPYLTHDIIRALNFHAIAHLYNTAGQFRKREVDVGHYMPPAAHKVEYQMGEFLCNLRTIWDKFSPIVLGSYVLWQINKIHPFENGNGRTAHAACHYVICTKQRAWLGGKPILPELIRLKRSEYIKALQRADSGKIEMLVELVEQLLPRQMNGH